jgi:hypothetical protein
MKLWEAMKALEEGKKVRKQNWNRYEYIFIDKTGRIADETGSTYEINRSNEGWELYDEREYVDELTKELYNIVSKMYKVGYNTSYDEYIDTIDAEEQDDTDYLTKLYRQLQHMNKTYKLD